jgi:hypothetical protein
MKVRVSYRASSALIEHACLLSQNYIANEGNFWDTSTACVRRNLGRAIELARACQLEEGDTLYEAYRLLGTGMTSISLHHHNVILRRVDRTAYPRGSSSTFELGGA